MNPLVVSGILTGIRSTLAWLTARRTGDRQGALDILRSVDLSPFGLDDDALEVVNIAKAGLAYLTRRGALIDDVIALIDQAEEDGVDITPEQVQEQLDVAFEELDETQDMIDELDDD